MKKIIEWAIQRPTVINLIMVGILLAGFLSISKMPKESFPEFSLDMIRIEVVHQGASAKEVEKGILRKIEESIESIDGISEVLAEAVENMASVHLQLERGVDAARALREVKDRIEQISTFPKDAEKARVFLLARRSSVMVFALSGGKSRSDLQNLADKVKDQLLESPLIKEVSLQGDKKREIWIEINEKSLRRYNLQIKDVTNALQKANIDLSGGTLRAKGEDLKLRAYGKKVTAKDLSQIIVRRIDGGHTIKVKDIAKARESFKEDPSKLYFDGKVSLLLDVKTVSGGSILSIAKQARLAHKEIQSQLPKGYSLSVYRDFTITLKDRISLLTKNGLQGLILVLIVLSFFMNLRLAFWVASGLLLSIIGTFVLAWATGLTINMISLFGVMLVTGILVDDAIVVAENIYAHIERGSTPIEAAINGTKEVFPAVVAAITTTCLTFLPLFFMGGFIGKFIYMIPAMVIAALVVSLFESLFILPAHLAHSLKARSSVDYTQGRVRSVIDTSINWVRSTFYASLLRFSLRLRWPVLALSLGLFMLTIGLMGGGFVKFVFFPQIEGDRIAVRFVMPPGTPAAKTDRLARFVEQKARELSQELKNERKEKVLAHSVIWIGRQTARGPGFAGPTGEEVGEVQLELMPAESRKTSSSEFVERWRKKVGGIPGALQVSFISLDTPPLGNPLEFRISMKDPSQLAKASAFLKKELGSFPGVFSPEDDLSLGKREMLMSLTPLAESLGLSRQQIATQIRYRFYGQEVMRLQRGKHEVRVVVRAPSQSRNGLEQLDDVWIRTGQGKQLPLSQLVIWKKKKALKSIHKINGFQVASIYAQLDESKGNRGDVIRALKEKVFPKMRGDFAGLQVVVAGQGKEQKEVFSGMFYALPIALFGIFFVLVLIFQSYGKVLIVMAMIPFGVIGAVLGHYFFGIPLTILSFFGIVGVSGVVVNDSIVLMDAINREVKSGKPVFEAVWLAGQSRLRPILSTTFTTAAGLLPLLMETSLQAQFLIPMALSLAAGVLFATFLTLILVPALYLIRNDLKRSWKWMKTGEWLDAEEIESEGNKSLSGTKKREVKELYSPAEGISGAVS